AGASGRRVASVALSARRPRVRPAGVAGSSEDRSVVSVRRVIRGDDRVADDARGSRSVAPRDPSGGGGVAASAAGGGCGRAAGTAWRPLRRAEFWLSWLGRFLPGTVRRLPKREKILEAVHKAAFADQPEEVWRSFVDWTASTPVATLAHQAQWLHRLDLRSEL